VAGSAVSAFAKRSSLKLGWKPAQNSSPEPNPLDSQVPWPSSLWLDAFAKDSGDPVIWAILVDLPYPFANILA
jgi:hypothetical protein